MDALGNVDAADALRRRPGHERQTGRWRRWRRSAWPTARTTARTSCPVASSSASRSRGRWSTRPSLILADEPTGNLDSRTSVEVMAILQRLNADGATIVLVTHEPDIAAHGGADRASSETGTSSSDRVVEQPASAEASWRLATTEDW